MPIEKQLTLADQILTSYRKVIGTDFNAYRNHVYRVINLCYAAGQLSAEDKEKIQIAACFHDIGIWTEGTLDYLPPSAKEAERYLQANGKDSWVAEIVEMIEMHHRTRNCTDSAYPLVEAFRRADVADFSLGLFAMGFPRSLIAELKAAFPNSGFHKRLAQLGSTWFVKHPFNPIPMFRR